MSRRTEWKFGLIAEPIVPSWSTESNCNVNGAELQAAILRGFADQKQFPVYTQTHQPFTFEKVFTFKEHGEFFRGALTMAGLRYTGDFFDLLQRYGTIKVTITKFSKEEGE